VSKRGDVDTPDAVDRPPGCRGVSQYAPTTLGNRWRRPPALRTSPFEISPGPGMPIPRAYGLPPTAYRGVSQYAPTTLGNRWRSGPARFVPFSFEPSNACRMAVPLPHGRGSLIVPGRAASRRGERGRSPATPHRSSSLIPHPSVIHLTLATPVARRSPSSSLWPTASSYVIPTVINRGFTLCFP